MKLRLIAVHSIFAIKLNSRYLNKLLHPIHLRSVQAYREHPDKGGMLVVVRDPVWG